MHFITPVSIGKSLYTLQPNAMKLLLCLPALLALTSAAITLNATVYMS